MVDYISRQAAIDALAKNMPTPVTPDGAGEFDHEIHIADEAFADAIRIIESIKPAADVAPVVHGRWSHIAYLKGIKVMECSHCGKRVLGSHNYCGNCGAKMDVKGEE